MTNTIKHFGRHTSSTLRSVLYLIHPKIKILISYRMKDVTDSNLTLPAGLGNVIFDQTGREIL